MPSQSVPMHGDALLRITRGQTLLEDHRGHYVSDRIAIPHAPIPRTSFRHESPIIRHLAANYMQKSMIAAVAQCEMYHVNLILHQSTWTGQGQRRDERVVRVDITPSIGTPPRMVPAPVLNDTRLVVPALTQNINNKWDSITLPDASDALPIGSSSELFRQSGPTMCDDPLNLNELLQSVAPTSFGQSSIRKTTITHRCQCTSTFICRINAVSQSSSDDPSVSADIDAHESNRAFRVHSTRPRNRTRAFLLEHIRTVETRRMSSHSSIRAGRCTELLCLSHRTPCACLQTSLPSNPETMSPTAGSTIDDYPHEMRQRRAPVDHASQLGAISDVTDEDEER